LERTSNDKLAEKVNICWQLETCANNWSEKSSQLHSYVYHLHSSLAGLCFDSCIVCLLAGKLKRDVWAFIKFVEQGDYGSEKSWLNFGLIAPWRRSTVLSESMVTNGNESPELSMVETVPVEHCTSSLYNI